MITPTLTGLGERAGEASADVNLDTHIADVAAALDGRPDAVLVAHSYAGFPAYGAAEQTAIGRLVLLDAFIPRDGETMADHVGERGDQYRAAAADDPRLAGARTAGGRARGQRGGLRMGRLEHDAAAGADVPAADRADRRRGAARPLLHRLHDAVARHASTRASAGWRGCRRRQLACGHDAMIAAPVELAALLLG